MPAVWKELGFRSYDAYISSRLWWSIRQIVLERDGKCCQVCGTPSKIVHHIDYTKIIMLGQGNQHELITLCEPCHNFVEQDKRVSEKKILLNQLFGQYSKNTLDEWQVWAEQFNTDIGYDTTRLFEPKRKKEKTKKHKIKKQPQPETVNIQPVEVSLRDEIDLFIKGHKKQKKKSGYNTNYYINKHKREQHCKTLVPATDENKKEFITNTVRKYSRKSKKNIKRYLDNHRPLIELLFNHPEASDKLKKVISEHPYFIKESTTNKTKEQKRQRRDEQYRKKKEIEQEEIVQILEQQEYQKKKTKKRASLFGKLPAWTTNHKAQSFQGGSPLMDRVKNIKKRQ